MYSPIRRHRQRVNPIRIGRMAWLGCLVLLASASAQAQNDPGTQATAAREEGTLEGKTGDARPAQAAPIALSQFTTGIEDREPIDQVTFVENTVPKVYFFSDLRGLEGTEVTHRWSFRGKSVAEVKFNVRGPRWRVWSSKKLQPGWTGDWTVEIVLEGGEVLASETFTYSAAPQ